MTAADGYAEYENCLRALAGIAGELARGVAAADRNHQEAVARASEAAQLRQARLNELARTVDDRYRKAVEALGTHGVRLPRQVRPEAGASGDDRALGTALDEQATAADAVGMAVRQAEESARRERADETRAAESAKRAAEALDARRQRVSAERTALEEARRRAEAEAAARRSRRRSITLAAVTVPLLLAATVVVILFTR